MADWKPRQGQPIQALFAWVATENDGGEGIVGATFEGLGVVPLVGADLDRMKSYRPAAETAKHMTGCRVRLVKFSHREDLDTL